MRHPAIALIALLFMGATAMPAISADSLFVYFGTQTRGKGEAVSKGVYRSTLDLTTGKLSKPVLAAECVNPGFLEIHPSGDFLYATSMIDRSGAIGAYSIDRKTGELTFLNRESTGDVGTCHVNVDPSGNVVAAANYGGGSASSLPLKADGSLGKMASFFKYEGSSVNERRQKEPHAHSANFSPDGKFVYICDLGTDKINIYALDSKTAKMTPADPAFVTLKPGAGPRHFTFHPNGKFAYVINELDSTVTAFSFDAKTGALTTLQSVPTLPDDFKGMNSTAEVRVHPSGKFLYGSNRGHDSIAVYRVNLKTGALTFVERETGDIAVPRNFNIDPTGKFCLVANQGGDSVVVFAIDQKTGALSPTGNKVAVPKPICVRFLKK